LPSSNGGDRESAPSSIDGVTLKIAIDSNGAVADVSAKVSERFTCEASLDMVHRLRRDCDAVLVGRSTVEIDDCTLTVRRVPTNKPQPIRVVIDPKLQIDLKEFKIATDGLPTIIVYALDSQNGKESPRQQYSIRKNNEFPNVILLGLVPNEIGSRRMISTKNLIAVLRREFDIQHVLVEGGPNTALQFLQEEMVDRAIVVRAPMSFSEGLPSNISSKTLLDAGLVKVSSYLLDADKVTCYSRPDKPWPRPHEDRSNSDSMDAGWP
jgi:diaminohydroxyphosphoribosylaminopyrimidine deaminase / 5-amino-6-(5-phosphoribosylamino)uracil reductase